MNDHALAHDPAAEAAAATGDGYDVRVLEPSPPAVADPPFWADDPADPTPSGAGPVVAAHSGGDLTWDELIEARPELAGFAADRWLGARPQLPELPANYPAALFDFHRLAYSVVAETRYQCNGKFGLRYTRGGFGTPFFGDDMQVRVAKDQLVVQTAAQARSTTITTLREAGEFAGVAPGTSAAEHDSPDLGDIDRPLETLAEVGEFLGAWFGLATAALEELRFSPGVVEPERVQLWPGHFDPAIAAGDAGSGRRATYGFSPGDHSHDEPYIYVAAWGDVDRSDPFWNEASFNGASLAFSDLAPAGNHYSAAVAFLEAGYDRLS
ncbi:MAG: hypothetical protein F4108_03330 [Acidimicrobiaceae bacterium]|nr:hypothetical protein [Acidimicrobiaceae bacterium]